MINHLEVIGNGNFICHCIFSPKITAGRAVKTDALSAEGNTKNNIHNQLEQL